VTGSSIAITVFDPRRQIGGMTHYARPRRESGRPSTAIYAAPAIVWLVRSFLRDGSEREQLEAQIFGGAVRTDAPRFVPGIHHQNAQVALELLDKQGVRVSSMDVGGERGRKIVFDTLTGESAVIRAADIRAEDWYPVPDVGN